MLYTDKTALISGASSGIGAEFARQLHALGANVILVARREEALGQLARELNNKRQDSAAYMVVDLTQEIADREGSIQELLRLMSETRIDILINNAGRGSFGLYDDLDIDKEIDQLTLNVAASMRLAHAVIPQMKKRHHGAIVQISSIAGFQPIPYMATYAATKAFNLFHALALRHELKPFGISVLAVCPGPTATEFGGVARVPGTSTGLARDDVQMVVKKSIAALTRNRAIVFPGLRASLVSLVPRLLPINVSTWFMKRLLDKTYRKSIPGKR